ncbi:DEAD-box ATP-dependent RNA helicase 28-like [Mastacembelus armatus]|uniref:DEAD-box ATP-dependent RNA helicase 28-like n=1 Tax=Mastacembelus armatus TaxID=205130 RepID=UPI000E45E8B5|nr:DEAD-box ATP-dependent RNA helicase 28-like [Mastacembelus armatus]XP_026184961.1 DEAD-box ATP-dependent RNA helicase 28-like [Mastacembelus armatus]XP_026184970.1 DEAD-box ATP-dependent RNA helicase 28-like [Mastacembelus armatus]
MGDKAVLTLFFILLCLIFLLIFLYKKLNKEAEGEYTVRNMYYKEGGIRDQVRGAVQGLETRLGVRLGHDNDTEDEDGEEMQEIHDEEGKVEDGSSQESDSEGEDQDERDDDTETCSKTKGDEASEVNSSFEGSESGEQAGLMDHTEETEIEEKKEETGEKMVEGAGKGEASGGAGLLIDLNQFSGSVTWSEEVGKEKDVTAL